ncbi:MAG: protoporphyrinogen/coproporphyrinogen oxidase [Planctomycetota bacterium]
MSARIAVAGGGPAGLMAARLLAESGHEVQVFEAGPVIGGLCRSRVQDGYTFDLAGGHIMYTRDQRVAAFWDRLFADEPCVVTQRDSRILHERDRFITYPFENALGELPLEHNLECAEAGIRAFLARGSTPEPDNFRDWIRWKMGSGVARHFMDPYNAKIWKAELETLGTRWIAGRVPDAPLEDILRAALGQTTEGYTHQSRFRYPLRGGFAAIHERIARPIQARIRCGHRVESIERGAGRDGGWRVDGERFDQVISTLPLHHLPRILRGLDPGAAAAAAGLRWRGVASYLFGIEGQWARPYCWVYLPHAWQGPSNRITYLSNYSPNNAPSGRASILAEVTYAPGAEPDITAAGRAALARSLGNAGLLDAERVALTDAELNPLGYILYELGFEGRRDTVLAALDALPGFHAIGRFGRYEYHNSDQVLAQAMDLVERLLPQLQRGGGPGS